MNPAMPLERHVVIDIETVPVSPKFESLTEEWQELWTDKNRYAINDGAAPSEVFERRAGVMAEFAKICCISVGYFYRNINLRFKVKSFCGTDEKALLTDVLGLFNRMEIVSNKWVFAGHNIKEFDIPFLCRRLVINGFLIPHYLDFQNMKPWETNIADTFQYWRFGDFKNYTSLNLLAACLGIPSPKAEMSGADVADYYWNRQDLASISKYCQGDVCTVANVLLKLYNKPLLEHSDIEFV